MSLSYLLLAAALAIPGSRLAIRFAPDHRLSPIAAAAAIREAAILWSPRGLVLEAAGGVDSSPITIVIAAGNPAGLHRCPGDAPQPAAAGQGEPLAAAGFVNGRPTGVITLFLDAVLRLVEGGRLAGTAPWQWPRLMRERIIGRALGRVIAHEVGHIVLGSMRHAPDGLMRPSHRVDELIEPGRQPFRLVGVADNRVASGWAAW